MEKVVRLEKQENAQKHRKNNEKHAKKDSFLSKK